MMIFLPVINTRVATVLTACGIETGIPVGIGAEHIRRLQQYLPLAVLKQKDPELISGPLYSCNSTYRLRY